MQRLRGTAASPGVAVGRVWSLTGPQRSDASVPVVGRQAEAERVASALDRTSDELASLAATLRSDGHDADAEIVETGVMLAQDPTFATVALTAVRERGRTAVTALLDAAETHAEEIAALEDPTLAARADDIRSVGRRAAGHAARPATPASNGGAALSGDGVVLVAHDLGPADVAELGAEVRAIALERGGVTAHAAIVARSLGLPMVVNLGDTLLGVNDGDDLVVDGSEGEVVLDPDPGRLTAARAEADRGAAARERLKAGRDLPAQTRDGRRLLVLTNAATAVEVTTGLSAGAEGAGLIRTELAFLDASGWPSEAEHRRLLEPLLEPLRDRVATVRVLDFGGDKTPPFLRGAAQRGLELLLANPDALAAQLRAVLDAARRTQLRVLLPMVRNAGEVRAARELLLDATGAVEGALLPELGAMVELPEAAESAAELAREVDFLSIGTNDLTHATLGSDRLAGTEALTHDPRVLRLIAATGRAAGAAHLPLEVCGEAASDPLTAPLLVGLGADELSVGASRVGVVREWMRALTASELRVTAFRALEAEDAGAVERLLHPIARELELLERGDAARESVERGDGVIALGN